jgi:ribosomal protein S18 acetylase RimI-like enzyme
MKKPGGITREIASRKGEVCRDILADLPEWFGIPAAIDDYVHAVERLPMFGYVEGDVVVGFLAIKPHTRFAAEAYVLGVKRARHRRGIGRRLFSHAERVLGAARFVYLTVKTLAPDRASDEYAATRKFYAAIGFIPIETFATLWGADNPCLMMIKPLAPPA